MSSAKERLARILAERKAKAAENSNGTQNGTKSSTGGVHASTGLSEQTVRGHSEAGTKQEKHVPSTGNDSSQQGTTGSSRATEGTGSSGSSVEVPTKPVTQVMVPGTSEAHPLAIKLWELEEALDKQMPDRAQILKQIHDSLKADPTVVTLLTDEAIGIIVKGLTDHTNTTIVAAPKRATTKRTQPLSLDLLD